MELTTVTEGSTRRAPFKRPSEGLLQRISSVKPDFNAQEEAIQFIGYHAPVWKLLLYCIGALCTGGWLFLLAQWSLRVQLKLLYKQCKLQDAEFVLVKEGQDSTLVRVTMLKRPGLPKRVVRQMSRISMNGGSSGNPTTSISPEEVIQPFRVIIHRCHRYYFHTGKQTFEAVPSMPADFHHTLAAKSRQARTLFHQSSQLADDPDLRLDREEQQQLEAELFASPSDRVHRMLWYGSNEIELPVKSLQVLITEELLQPLYVFQYASVTIWFLEEYYGYGVVILAITAVALLITCWTAHRSQARLARMAAFSCPILVPGTGSSPAPTMISSKDLLPGDLVWVGNGQLPCDAVLLVGTCIVDESSLTGEPGPVQKTPAPDSSRRFSPDNCQASMLFTGTSVLHSDAPDGCPGPLALVCRTGAHTAKGQLMRSLLQRPCSLPHFSSDAVRYICSLLLLAAICYAWALATLRPTDTPAGTLILRALDMITIAVPPGLPACLALAMCIAMWRLRKAAIHVSVPHKLPLAGDIDTCLFDKTGTLTEPGLHMAGLALKPERDEAFEKVAVRQVMDTPERVQEALATCHSLAVLQSQLVGDPLDRELFVASGWRLSQDGREARPSPLAHTLGSRILRRWDFTSESRRSMVVVQDIASGALRVHCKGAPEVLSSLVKPSSLPPDHVQALARFTSAGMRVIGLASGRLLRQPAEVQQMGRAEAEECLEFVGLALLANPVRTDSGEVILSLQAAHIRTAMVTGDHVHTAIAVARQCSLLPPNRPTAVVDAEGGVGMLTCLAPDSSFQVLDLASLLPLIAEGGASCAVTAKGWEWAQAQQSLVLEQVLLGQAGVWARMGPTDKQALVQRMSAPHPARYHPSAIKNFHPSKRDGSLLRSPASSDGLSHAPAKGASGLGAGFVSKTEVGAPNNGLPAWGLGAHVAFCGDGANDAGALKAAQVGLSLCQSETSVAAPFTSQHCSISCMLQVILHGRCALATAFLIFKYILAYATCQLVATTFVYSYGLRMGNYQFLIQDLFFSTALATCLGLAKPANKLAIKRPPIRLLSSTVYLPLILQLCLCAIVQAFALGMLSNEPGYERPDRRTSAFLQARSPENTIVFLISLAQLVMLALVFDGRSVHRKPFWRNPYIVATAFKQCMFLIYLFATDGEQFSYNFCGIVEVPGELRIRLLFLLGAQIMLAFSLEKFSAALLMQQPNTRAC